MSRPSRTPTIDPRVVAQLLDDAGYPRGQPLTPALLLLAQAIVERCVLIADSRGGAQEGSAGRAIRDHFGITPHGSDRLG